MKHCCCKNEPEQIEFPIDSCFKDWEIYIDDYYPNIKNLCELKQKIILDFLNIVNKLECGIQPDLEFLLQEISIVYIKNE